MPIPNHELLAKVELLEERLERLERLGISPEDLEEHLARLKRLESFMECIEGYLDRLERLSVPLSRLEERLDLRDGSQPAKPNRPSPQKLVQSKVEVKEFLASLMQATATPQRGFSLKSFSLKRWFLRRLGRR